MAAPSRVPLIVRPTPLHLLERVSEDLGHEIWIKRDDLTGFAMGGNKGRKLEFLLADAMAKGATCLIGCGARQSNFIRQMGAAANMFGLRCVALCMRLPYEEAFGKPDGRDLSSSGNPLLDNIAGVELETLPDGTWDELFEAMQKRAEQLEAEGENVYVIPVGGSSVLGSYAYNRAGIEIDGQIEENFDWIVTPTSSCSTHAGLAYFYYQTETKVQGIACDPEEDLLDELARLATELEQLTGAGKAMSREEFLLNRDYVGPGYGVPSPAGLEAIAYLMKLEGILLDPIYSGKAFSGLLGLIESGEISGRICFLHTGGLPALFGGAAQETLDSLESHWRHNPPERG